MFSHVKPVTGAGEYIRTITNPKVIAKTENVKKEFNLPKYVNYVVFYAKKRDQKKNTYIKLGEYSRKELVN